MGSQISLERKLKLYEAQVVSVLIYNANSWSPTKSSLNKLDVTHRRHLRAILNIKYPAQISNDTLYLNGVTSRSCLRELINTDGTCLDISYEATKILQRTKHYRLQFKLMMYLWEGLADPDVICLVC